MSKIQGQAPGAPPEELAGHEKAQEENWAHQNLIHQQMKTLVRTMLAGGDPTQAIDLLEAAGLPYETVTPPAKRLPTTSPPPATSPNHAPGQDLLF